MHEIAAVLMWAVQCDVDDWKAIQSHAHPTHSKGDGTIPVDATSAQMLCDPLSMEADAWALFSVVMEDIAPLYAYGDEDPEALYHLIHDELSNNEGLVSRKGWTDYLKGHDVKAEVVAVSPVPVDDSSVDTTPVTGQHKGT